ncbi:MAG TPA: hypothetical protein VKF62_03170 [Planctomycetota bacterium]|nr:hypothetical protein [Planctomycetota bacterium]
MKRLLVLLLGLAAWTSTAGGYSICGYAAPRRTPSTSTPPSP